MSIPPPKTPSHELPSVTQRLKDSQVIVRLTEESEGDKQKLAPGSSDSEDDPTTVVSVEEAATKTFDEIELASPIPSSSREDIDDQKVVEISINDSKISQKEMAQDEYFDGEITVVDEVSGPKEDIQQEEVPSIDSAQDQNFSQSNHDSEADYTIPLELANFSQVDGEEHHNNSYQGIDATVPLSPTTSKEFVTEPFVVPGSDNSSEGESALQTSEFIVRSHKRYRRRIPIDIECDGQKFSTYSVDISVGGIYLEEPLPSWVAGYSKVRLKNKESRQVVELTCFIVENQRPNHRYRVALLPLKDPKDEEQLETWIKAA